MFDMLDICIFWIFGRFGILVDLVYWYIWYMIAYTLCHGIANPDMETVEFYRACISNCSNYCVVWCMCGYCSFIIRRNIRKAQIPIGECSCNIIEQRVFVIPSFVLAVLQAAGVFFPGKRQSQMFWACHIWEINDLLWFWGVDQAQMGPNGPGPGPK